MPRAIAPTESHLKVRLLNELRRTKRIRSSTVLANELPLGNSGLRADMAFHSKLFYGVEIKSERDSLKRLNHQLPIYLSYFDKVILLVGSKHWNEIEALELGKVELWIASGLSIRRVRTGERADQLSDHSQLLPQKLQLKYADEKNSRRAYLNAFRERFKETSKIFWESTHNRTVVEEDLPLLSRFSAQREQSAEMIRQQTRNKDAWLQELAQSVQSSSVSKKDLSSE